MAEFRVQADGIALTGEDSGEGTPVVLLHGLTATRRYVVMGSTALQRSDHRVIAYDARAHGHSDPGAPYTYERLASDLLAILDDREIDRAVLAGASMGAHTLAQFARMHPERVAGLAIITPAFDPDENQENRFDRWDRLAHGLRTGGVEGFIEAYGDPGVPENWRETVLQVIRQRLAAHEHPEALADALKATPRSRPFPSVESLGAIEAPTVVVADRDEADPGHPLAIGEAYARTIPGAELVVEEEGKSPIAWQGSQLSKIIADVAGRV